MEDSERHIPSPRQEKKHQHTFNRCYVIEFQGHRGFILDLRVTIIDDFERIHFGKPQG